MTEARTGVAAHRLRLTDTTFRDGNQSLLGGRLRPAEILPLAAGMDAIGFAAMEAFGGATFETWLQLGEDPWKFLEDFRAAAPRTPLQALIRGQNLVGHHNFADDTVELFVAHAAACGIDIFRVFDPLNDIRNMESAIGAAKKAGRTVQGALSYAVSTAHTLESWCSLARGLVDLGADAIVVKDTSGLLSPQATWELVTALREAVKVDVAVHSHCSSGMAPMSYMAAVEAGASILDTAMSPLAWGASQPGTESVVAALAGGEYDTGLDLEQLSELRDQLERVKWLHAEHFSPFVDRVDADILRYRMPGFMLEQIHRELEEHEAKDRLREVLEEVPRVRRDLGEPPLVAPVRQLIASQAVFNVLGGERYATVTQELKDYLQGLYGRPPAPADPQVRRLVLGREEPITIRPADLLDPQVEGARAELRRLGLDPTDGSTLIHILFPALAGRFLRGELAPASEPEAPASEAGTETEAADAGEVTAEAGATEVAADAPAPVPAPVPASAEFEVEVEGEVFRVRVSGQGFAVTPSPVAGAPQGGAAPAPPRPQGGITAPMQGLIVKLPVKKGDEVKLGDVVAVLEAMKMQNDIVSTVAGKVLDVYVSEGDVVSPGQSLVAVG